MARVTYVLPDETERTVDVPIGETVMRAALNNMIDSIVGECGGGLACATCHCYVDEAWIEKIGSPSKEELEMLECAATPARPNSRLSCQICVSDALDGLVVRLPEAQF